MEEWNLKWRLYENCFVLSWNSAYICWNVAIYQATRRYISKERNFRSHQSEKLESKLLHCHWVKNKYSRESFIYPTDAQLDCSKNVKIYIKIYIRGAATCFGFPQPSSGSYCMCFAKVIIINNTRQQILDDWMLRLTEYTIFMFLGPQNTKMTLKFIF